MRINVTRKHIREGLRYMGSSDKCVIARAVQDATKDPTFRVGVYSYWYDTDPKQTANSLPSEIGDFIAFCARYSVARYYYGTHRTFLERLFSGDDRPKPFSFELNL